MTQPALLQTVEFEFAQQSVHVRKPPPQFAHPVPVLHVQLPHRCVLLGQAFVPVIALHVTEKVQLQLAGHGRPLPHPVLQLLS